MKRIVALVLFGLLLLAPGCISFRLTAEDNPSLKASGLGTAYVGYSGFDEWDGSIIKLGLLGGEGRAGEVFSFDIWPLGGIGVGLAGVRVRVLPIEMGAGALFYKPRLPERQSSELPEDLPGPEEEPVQGEPRRKIGEAENRGEAVENTTTKETENGK